MNYSVEEYDAFFTQEIKDVDCIDHLHCVADILLKAYWDGYFKERSVQDYLQGLYKACDSVAPDDERLSHGELVPWQLFAELLVKAFDHEAQPQG